MADASWHRSGRAHERARCMLQLAIGRVISQRAKRQKNRAWVLSNDQAAAVTGCAMSATTACTKSVPTSDSEGKESSKRCARSAKISSGGGVPVFAANTSANGGPWPRAEATAVAVFEATTAREASRARAMPARASRKVSSGQGCRPSPSRRRLESTLTPTSSSSGSSAGVSLSRFAIFARKPHSRQSRPPVCGSAARFTSAPQV
mmetsp:Transcript_75421/g.196133  ORF Transcript_75421/g.196133 Transcript_75421/m.196133 type:complete len:205 (-) Transcript_75421:2306-2920(-)